MAAASGKFGKVAIGSSTLVECTGWTLNREVAEHTYASCATSGYRKRVAGTEDATGTVEGVLDPADPIEGYIEPGDSVTLKLYYTTTKFHSVPALILTLEEEDDVEDGEIIRWTSNWGLNGTPTWNTT